METNPHPLTEFEQQLIQDARCRWPTFITRHQHLLGWLSIPLILLAFTPRFGRYQNWFGCGALLLGIFWYRSVARSAIGKLAGALGDDESTRIRLPKPQPRPLINRRIFGLLLYLCIFPVAACCVLLTKPFPIASMAFLEEALATTLEFGFILALPLFALAFFVYFVSNHRVGEAMMALAAQLALWFFIFALIGAAILTLTQSK